MKSFEKIENIRDIRKKLGLNQMDFWSRIGVTQSGGSRYESGRNMPKPVRELLRLVHIERVDLAKVNRDDLAVASLLKNRDPELYASLKKEAKSDTSKSSSYSKGRLKLVFRRPFYFLHPKGMSHTCPFSFTADTV